MMGGIPTMGAMTPTRPSHLCAHNEPPNRLVLSPRLTLCDLCA